MSTYRHIQIPRDGEKVTVQDGKIQVPDQPIMFTSKRRHRPDITKACLRIWDAAWPSLRRQAQVHWCETSSGKRRRLYTATTVPTRR